MGLCLRLRWRTGTPVIQAAAQNGPPGFHTRFTSCAPPTVKLQRTENVFTVNNLMKWDGSLGQVNLIRVRSSQSGQVMVDKTVWSDLVLRLMDNFDGKWNRLRHLTVSHACSATMQTRQYADRFHGRRQYDITRLSVCLSVCRCSTAKTSLSVGSGHSLTHSPSILGRRPSTDEARGYSKVSKQARTIIVSKANRVTVQALYNHRGRKC